MDIITETTKIVFLMQQRGIPVDMTRVNELKEYIKREEEDILREIYKAIGEIPTYNPRNSIHRTYLANENLPMKQKEWKKKDLELAYQITGIDPLDKSGIPRAMERLGGDIFVVKNRHKLKKVIQEYESYINNLSVNASPHSE